MKQQLEFDFTPRPKDLCICGKERKRPKQQELIDVLLWSLKRQLSWWDRRTKWHHSNADQQHWCYLLKCIADFHYYLGESANTVARYSAHILERAGWFTQLYGVEALVIEKTVWTPGRALWVENPTRDDLARHFTCNFFANGYLVISHDGKIVEEIEKGMITTRGIYHWKSDEITGRKIQNLMNQQHGFKANWPIKNKFRN